jgi:hypothetical protein
MKLLMVPAILACSGNVFEDVSNENHEHDLKLDSQYDPQIKRLTETEYALGPNA